MAARTMLVIDDEPTILEALVELFADAGSTTISAKHSAQVALWLPPLLDVFKSAFEGRARQGEIMIVICGT
jgi:hypothetical protein